ncbi:iron-hydroxamate ABC transporter substrate-binding protein [Bacillus sp. FJAT-45037]|uniref:iron-hydroxamate ABC transporter substrate-binding protein n=1 Tax=Bacillus sp. FJAT-45037 TaxID=2011007 RepID=UPI000C237DEB|nr:iron-hydroxamate ABC transporter substrate-binding protein [Bacillus sp. FJAT-45037]
MKKTVIIPFLMLLVLLISACGSNSEETSPAEEEQAGTFTYESENGPIEVPADPQRVVVLSSFNAGSVMALDVNIVAVDSWAKMNERYAPYIEDAEEVTDESLEKIIELDPDLIIAAPTNNNLDKLGEIAPTVTYTYGELDYLSQHVEIGKLLNKEEEAQAWVDDFKERAQASGEEVKEKIGEDATVTVVENFDKQLYVFGDNWGRGTEILYQEMELAMPEKVEEMALNEGYYALSVEVLPEYAGDYMIVSSDGVDTAYQETDTYKNIPAVANERVFTANASEFYFNDPITLDFQLDFFTESFLSSN